MYAQKAKAREKSRAVSNSVSQKKGNMKQSFGFVDNRPESVAQHKIADNRSNSSGGEIVQMVLDDAFTAVSSVNKITSDVWAVKYGGGDIIIKFKGDLAADVIADKALRDLGANAPESKLVAANTLFTGLNKKWFAPAPWMELRDRLKEMGTTQVLVADKLKGEALGTTATDKTDALSDQVVASTDFAKALGKVAAFDLLLGHQDRIILGALNLGNMMTLPSNSSTLQQIDNQIAENDTGLLVANLTNVANALKTGNTSTYGAAVHRSINLAMKDDPTIDSGFKVGHFDAALMSQVTILAGNLDELKASLTTADEITGTDAKAILKRNIARFETARTDAQAALR